MEKSLILNKDRFSVSLHLDSCAECYHLCNLGLRKWLYYCVLQTAKCGKLLDLHRSAIHLSNSTIKGSSYNESWGIPLVGGGFSWCPSTSDQNRTLEINFGKRLDLLWVRATSLWKASNFKGRSLLPIHTLLKGDGRCKIEDVSYFAAYVRWCGTLRSLCTFGDLAAVLYFSFRDKSHLAALAERANTHQLHPSCGSEVLNNILNFIHLVTNYRRTININVLFHMLMRKYVSLRAKHL